MITSKPVNYMTVANTAAATVKPIHGEFYGFSVITSTSATVTVRDGGASGTVVYVSPTLTVGQTVNFGGCGILCKNDIHVTVGGTGSVRIWYI